MTRSEVEARDSAKIGAFCARYSRQVPMLRPSRARLLSPQAVRVRSSDCPLRTEPVDGDLHIVASHQSVADSTAHRRVPNCRPGTASYGDAPKLKPLLSLRNLHGKRHAMGIGGTRIRELEGGGLIVIQIIGLVAAPIDVPMLA